MEILNLRGAAKGTGGTALAGARRARFVSAPDVKRASVGAAGLPGGAWKTGAASQLIIEVEGVAETVAALRGELTNQTIVLYYRRSDGNYQRRVKYCTAIAVGESRFPPAEGSGRTPLSQITFAIHAGSGVETWSQALVDVSGGEPPAALPEPLVRLLSVTRSGSPLAGAVQAALRGEFAVTTARRNGYGVPVGAWALPSAIRVMVEMEDEASWLAALQTAPTDEVLVLTFQAGLGTRYLTCQIARLVDPGQEELKSPEEAQTPTRTQLVWELVTGTGVAGPTDALVLT